MHAPIAPLSAERDVRVFKGENLEERVFDHFREVWNLWVCGLLPTYEHSQMEAREQAIIAFSTYVPTIPSK